MFQNCTGSCIHFWANIFIFRLNSVLNLVVNPLCFGEILWTQKCLLPGEWSWSGQLSGQLLWQNFSSPWKDIFHHPPWFVTCALPGLLLFLESLEQSSSFRVIQIIEKLFSVKWWLVSLAVAAGIHIESKQLQTPNANAKLKINAVHFIYLLSNKMARA